LISSHLHADSVETMAKILCNLTP